MAISVALATAAPSGALTAPTPANTSAPTLSGTPTLGQTLTCAPGAWSGNPSGFSYTWLRDGAPIAGQSGSTYIVQSADEGHSISCAVTAANVGGEYTISGLPTGSYKVSFNIFEGNYLPQYYNGQLTSAKANAVAVSAPNTTSGINAEPQPGGQIAGRVTNAGGTTPIASAEVCAFEPGGEFFGGCATTNANGEYTISGLPAGTYTVEFSGPECFESGCTPSNYLGQEQSGVMVSVPTTISGINAELQPGGQIAGKVTNSGTTALAGIEVCTGKPGSEFFEDCTITDGAGEYTISGLSTGSYDVAFYATEVSGGNYEPRFYEEKASIGEAESVSVTAGAERSGIDAKMQPGGQIAGKVTDASGTTPLEGVEVCADESSEGFFEDCAFTDSAGEYTISGLSTGSYDVSFYGYNGGYLPRFYNEQESSSEAEAVSVTAGAERSNIDAKMQPGGQIAGKVSDASTHAGIAEAEVCARQVSGGGGRCALSGSGGEYTISGLPTGSYTVSFSASEGNNYLTQYYGDQPTRAKADAVSVSAPSTTPAIDAELTHGGQLTGRVINPSTHTGIAGVEVCAFTEGSETFGGCALTNSAGSASSAKSSALAVPAPNSHFALRGKVAFDAKTGDVLFSFQLSNAGKLSWSLFFRNSDVGFADSLAISAGAEGGTPTAQAAGKKGKGKAKKCTKGSVKHKGKCVRSLVPFASGSENVASPGTVQVMVHASSKAIKALKTGHSLHVSGTFTFQSALGGPAVTQTESAVVKAPKSKGKHHGKHGH